MVTFQLMVRASEAALLTTGNIVLHSKVPEEAALKMPASVIAPAPVPAGNVAE